MQRSSETMTFFYEFMRFFRIFAFTCKTQVMKIYRYFFGFLLLICFSVLMACKPEPPIDNTLTYGKVSFSFTHKVDGQPMVVDTFQYTNAAGNVYLVNEIQYFISDIVLLNAEGENISISQDNGIHYVDTDLSATQIWSIAQDIPAGNYTGIAFTFGINEVKNQSNMFVNPPESNMFWPEYLGGGYHVMKLNGQWLDPSSTPRMFNFHLGIGQIYASNVIVIDSITSFVQNYFQVTVPASSFTISENKTTTIEFVMKVDSWFDTPHVWDHNIMGTNIMQNQPAMQKAKWKNTKQ
jgi:hypothetical protein